MALGGRQRVSGGREFSRLLRALPGALREEMLAEQEETGRVILGAQRAEAPKRTGALAGGLSMRLSRVTMRLRVGVLGRPVARRLFYARIVEGGRKAQAVAARRRGTTYVMRIRARAARPFVRSNLAFRLRDARVAKLGSVFDRAVARASGGSGG